LVLATGFSPERKAILEGFLLFRNELKKMGLQGFQWVDGSFVEDVENSERRRPPSDVDLLTWVFLPEGLDPEKQIEWYKRVAAWYYGLDAKANFKCDAYIAPVFPNGTSYMDDAIYWSGLFSHSKEGESWKGFFQVGLADDENEAMMILKEVAK
jgi:hypothetical protein